MTSYKLALEVIIWHIYLDLWKESTEILWWIIFYIMWIRNVHIIKQKKKRKKNCVEIIHGKAAVWVWIITLSRSLPWWRSVSYSSSVYLCCSSSDSATFYVKTFHFSFFVSDTYGNKFGALGNTEGFPYDCTVDPPFVGYVSIPGFWLFGCNKAIPHPLILCLFMD